ncbi:alpha/beta fold hydrolase [Streptomyces rimosus]|uniref:alpha/beta hydrolase n=1 Tax=Streptomyces rimosus TaxID=1927 RepID=UPI00099888A0
MVNYVLAAGAWLGAWAWDEVVPLLRTAGHGAYPLTLSGLADKRGVPAGQQTHVEDIVGEVDRLGLDDVVLVGHSYSGIPVGQAAERIGERLRHVIFVDSDVPVDGESFVSRWPDFPARGGGVDGRERGLLGPAAPGRICRSRAYGRADRAHSGQRDAASGRHLDRTRRTGRPSRRASGDIHQVRAGRTRADSGRGRDSEQREVAAGRTGDGTLADALRAG